VVNVGDGWCPALFLLAYSIACGGGSGREDDGETLSFPPTGSATDGTSASTTGSSQSSTGTTDGGTDDGFKFDVGAGDAGGEPVDKCKVIDDMDAVGDCRQSAPPDSFTPGIQWSWTGPNGDLYSIVTPLVINLTDDNDDGEIDLCDIPDVIVVASPSSGSVNQAGHIYVLDGATGDQHFRIETAVDHTVTPAVGDIDGDGLPDIVTAVVGGQLIAFAHDGSVKWQGTDPWPDAYSGAIALADLDNDGTVEIIAGNFVTDHLGTRLWTAPQPAGNWSATAAADLDGDGTLEVVLGHAAYHHDGTPYYVNADISPGYPQIGNLDGDPQPEVLVTNQNGITVLEHDGTPKYTNLRPTGDPVGFTTWLRPATIHDFNGDGEANYASSSANHYTAYRADATILWTAVVSDQSGIAAGTAFDFLGNGTAEAMYADEHTLFVFDVMGTPIFDIPRTSGTLTEYPVVADIDNDGSAEIVVVSNQYLGSASPTVQVIRDADDRWIQARRIWNQHTYHVTNVREDGSIPRFEPPHWEHLNTFRTNAQIEDGGVCTPTPVG
jgi:hypothetical protein